MIHGLYDLASVFVCLQSGTNVNRRRGRSRERTKDKLTKVSIKGYENSFASNRSFKNLLIAAALHDDAHGFDVVAGDDECLLNREGQTLIRKYQHAGLRCQRDDLLGVECLTSECKHIRQDLRG